MPAERTAPTDALAPTAIIDRFAHPALSAPVARPTVGL
jgi:hypothetical protein